MASKLGWEGDTSEHADGAFAYDEHRNDVKLAVFTLYEIITRDMHLREENYPHELDMSMVLGPNAESWEKHPDVCLDADVAEYRGLLEEWLGKRRLVDQEVTHFSQVPDALDWSMLPDFPVGSDGEPGRSAQMRQEMIMRGESNFLRWQRPGSRELPLLRGQHLLVTGEVVNKSTSKDNNLNTL